MKKIGKKKHFTIFALSVENFYSKRHYNLLKSFGGATFVQTDYARSYSCLKLTFY